MEKECPKVFFSMGLTINLGNYESLKIDSGVTLPVEPDDDITETADKAYKFVRKEIKEKLGKSVKFVKKLKEGE